MKVRVIAVEKLSSIFKPIEFDEKIYYCTLVGSNLVGFPADKKFKIIEPTSKDHVVIIKKRENLLLGTKLYDVNGGYTVALVYSNRLTSATGLKTSPYIAVIKDNHTLYLREIGTKMDNEINVVLENVKEEIDKVINAIEELLRKNVTLKRIERDAIRFWELYNKYAIESTSKKKEFENVKTNIDDELDLDLSDMTVNVSSDSDDTLL